MPIAREDQIPPFYNSPQNQASPWAMLTRAITDPASVIPAVIYQDWSVKLPMLMAPIVFAHPDDVRTVLLDKGDRFGRNRQLRLLMQRAWGKGLAAAEGESWAAQRRAAAPAFRPQAVAESAKIMASVAQKAGTRWRAGEPVELGSALGRIVAEIVMSTLLTGIKDLDFDQLAADIPVFVREASTFGLMDFLPISDAMLNRLRGLGHSEQEARLRALAARLADLRANPPDATQDIPALLRGVGPLADNILGSLPAGFETSALAAAWAVYLLALYPEWQDAVRAEAEAGGEPVLARQVAQEVLRLYPPAPMLVRAAMAPTMLRGHRLRTGQVALLPVFAIHRHRQLWDRPDMFDPNRFAPDASYDRGAFLPFGAGPRLCIAASFALTEIAVVMAELVKLFRFTPVGDAPIVSLQTTTRSVNGLNVVVSALN
jgi:cytochrome P450